jgi:hypothetical protein
MRKLKILQNIDRRIALDDIANALGIDFEELLDELEGIVLYSGNKINIDYFLDDIMDPDDVSDICEYLLNRRPMIWRLPSRNSVRTFRKMRYGWYVSNLSLIWQTNSSVFI